MSEQEPESPPPSVPDDGSQTDGEKPRKRKRNRKRKRKHPEAAAAPSEPPPDLSALTAGLFSHIDDREVRCKVDGCDQMWTWPAHEQIKAYGQPPPKRMCREHYALFHTLEDKEVPCASPDCDKTWTWSKNDQMLQSRRAKDPEPPSRACDDCRKEEKELGDTEVPCRVDGCRRTWSWPRDAQLRHRTWLRHQGSANPDAAPQEEVPSGDGKKRRRRRRGQKPSTIPRRMCELCKTKLGRLVERESTCKVHGCTRTVTIEKEGQLRAWAAMGTEDLEVEAALPKRMCDVCREFCRLHPDREVECGRPGCSKTWPHKTGAQLQAFLAGKLEDPIRLCAECATGDFVRAATEDEATREVPEGAEIMPCIVPGCEGTWLYHPGMQVAPADDGDQPVDRMCVRCQNERSPAPEKTPDEVSAKSDAPEVSLDPQPMDASMDTPSEPSTQESTPTST